MASYLRVVSHDVVQTRQEAQTGTDLYVHCAVHVVEEIQRFIYQLTALFQKTWRRKNILLFVALRSRDVFGPTDAVTGELLTLLYFSLAALEEVEGVGRFGVDVLHHGENVQDVFLCEGWLVAAVEVILFNQDLESGRTGATK